MPLTLRDRLRRKLGDRIPPGASDDDAFFTDADLDDLLDEATNDLNLAAANGWVDKMAEFVKLVDREDAGSTRRLSQLARNAKLMVDHYAGLAGLSGSVVIKGRSVGRAISLRDYEFDPVMATSGTMRFLGSQPELIRHSNPDVPEGYPAEQIVTDET